MSEERWRIEAPATGLEVGQIVRNDTTGHVGRVESIKEGVATIVESRREDRVRMDKSMWKSRWG